MYAFWVKGITLFSIVGLFLTSINITVHASCEHFYPDKFEDLLSRNAAAWEYLSQNGVRVFRAGDGGFFANETLGELSRITGDRWFLITDQRGWQFLVRDTSKIEDGTINGPISEATKALMKQEGIESYVVSSMTAQRYEGTKGEAIEFDFFPGHSMITPEFIVVGPYGHAFTFNFGEKKSSVVLPDGTVKTLPMSDGSIKWQPMFRVSTEEATWVAAEHRIKLAQQNLLRLEDSHYLGWDLSLRAASAEAVEGAPLKYQVRDGGTGNSKILMRERFDGVTEITEIRQVLEEFRVGVRTHEDLIRLLRSLVEQTQGDNLGARETLAEFEVGVEVQFRFLFTPQSMNWPTGDRLIVELRRMRTPEEEGGVEQTILYVDRLPAQSVDSNDLVREIERTLE